MRKLTFIAALTASLAGCSGPEPGGCPGSIDCAADLAMARDLGQADLHCTGDLAGDPRQICGMPDASFSPTLCICLGDP